MASNHTLTIRLTKEQLNNLKDVAKRNGYLQLAPFIRGIIFKEAKEKF